MGPRPNEKWGRDAEIPAMIPCPVFGGGSSERRVSYWSIASRRRLRYTRGRSTAMKPTPNRARDGQGVPKPGRLVRRNLLRRSPDDRRVLPPVVPRPETASRERRVLPDRRRGPLRGIPAVQALRAAQGGRGASRTGRRSCSRARRRSVDPDQGRRSPGVRASSPRRRGAISSAASA